jgi:nitrogen fixation protein NifX
MKIAFASKDNIHVNEHFGWCQEFYIYEIKGNEAFFVKSVDASQDIEEEVDKLTYKIECLDQSDILYVQQIGPKASMMVKAHKIFPLQSSKEGETINDVLNTLIEMKRNPPLWMQRILINE